MNIPAKIWFCWEHRAPADERWAACENFRYNDTDEAPCKVTPAVVLEVQE